MAYFGKYAVMIVCFLYLPSLTAAFFKKRYGLSKREFGELPGARKPTPKNTKNSLFFKGSHLEPITVVGKHGSVVLECNAGGYPSPTIHWLKDGERITQGAVHTSHDDSAAYEDHYTTGGTAFMRLGQTNSKLYLDCVTNKDEGEYTCVAETPMLRKTQTTQVKVEKREKHIFADMEECVGRRSAPRGSPARVYMSSTNRLEFEGSKVQLFCRAEGSPQPTITWYDTRGEPIRGDNEQYRIAKNGDLIIRDISFVDMGFYECEASNGYGIDSAETFLYPVARTKEDDQFISGLW